MERLPSSITHRAMGGGVLSGVTAPLADAMGSADPVFGLVGDVLRIIEAQLDRVRPGAERRQALAAATPSIWPVTGGLSSSYGSRRDPFTGSAEFHSGLDISAERGQPVLATADGTVLTARWSGNFGNLVVVDHGYGIGTRYGHLSRFAVSEGQTIRKGDVVGFVGSTGRSTSPHVHYELLLNGAAHQPAAAARTLVLRLASLAQGGPPRSLAGLRPTLPRALGIESWDTRAVPRMIIDTLLAKVIGTQNERELKRIRPLVAEINAKEPEIQALSDEALRGKTVEFRQRLANGEALDDLLPEAFAVVREAGKRTLNMRHFDVQLIGGIVLHRGKIAEMKTGEGKTLVATLPAYLNALEGKGVHVVTVNDYLARRDSEWMGRIYRFLGMSVGVIQHDLNDQERQVAYGSDITYGTNNEFGFDYLRDNMKFDLAHYVQRGHHFAIVDEVDSILIDEARTPLIISGPAEESTDLYYEVDRIIPKLTPGATTRGDVKAEDREELEKTGDYIVDEKHKTVTLTETGMAKAEKMLPHRLQPGGLYDPANMPLLHHINQALRAHSLFRLDVDYMIKDGGVVIVDEFTGRLMPGRRWSDGLHQAVEAKEKVKIERENQTLATVTFQNYFRKYGKLSGMTGTADTEAEEFAKIYKLDVMVIPTNRELKRIEEPDTVYRTEREKYEAIVTDILEKQEQGRPVLVGTVSIEKSERLSKLLKLRGIKHVVLNAKYHAQEAEIVAQAGRKATVTIATNMAGRGTDILLGGNAEFMARQQTLGDEIAEKLPKSEAKFVDDDEFVYFYHLDNFYRVPREAYERIYQALKTQTDAEHDEVVGARRPAHHRDRAPRSAAHRQPAARPRRPSGRSRLVALLPVARRRPDADLRLRPHLGADAAARHGRGRADRAQDGDQRHRPRPEAGRGAELLRPQAPPRIRRRDEQAARERLLAAPRAARRPDQASPKRKPSTRAST